MPGPVAPISECCAPSCDEPILTQVPGPAGSDGADGAAGADGVSSFTTTTAQFTMPAEGANVSVPVVSTAWMTPGQTLFVQTAGHMEVVSLTNSVTAVLKNLENTASLLYPNNAAPTTAIPSGSKVSPAGTQGASGALTGAAGGDLKGTFPNPKLLVANTKGSIPIGNGTDTVDLAVGANGRIPHADSGLALGVGYKQLDLSGVLTALINALPIANGGTGQATAILGFNALSPLTTRADMIRRGATNNERFGPSATGDVVYYNGTDAVFAKLIAANLGTLLGVLPVDYLLYRDDKATTTAGGTFTSGSWVTHVLQTEVADTGSHGAVAANQVTLAAGTYRFRGRGLGYKVDNHQVRLQNITAGTTVGFGSNARSAAAGDDVTMSEVEGRFTIAGATVFELQSRCTTTRATDGFGTANSFGGTECYASLEFWREAL